ncbi:S41 family peptidase [Salegentibacter sp. LM13S]|uniref:S41 family peptidase n=1 Tax=Salegentibacter lacus TaxID=2873599 RepID=UPI001CCAB0F3|nr:S41 family peptidase [Salegentibacter lacus]MBZ9629744.1 S41 family peptidase [Salegentibacter lacus]
MKIFLLAFSLLNFQLAFTQTVANDSINGIWKMNGYGKIIEITKSEVNTFDITKISCILNSEIQRNQIGQLGKFKVINEDTLNLKLGITNYYLHRIKELPKNKIINDSIKAKNLKLNFDVFWHTLNENYAFFKERNLDWQHIYEAYGPQADTIKNEQELYEIFRQITDHLNDDHTSVIPTEDIRIEYEKKSDSLEESNSSTNLSIAELEDKILYQYVENPSRYGKSLHGNGLINYGIASNNIGYIQLNNMLFFANYKVSDSLSGYDYLFAYLKESRKNPNYQEDEIKGIKRIMDTIVNKFKNTDAIILDLRFNYGGYDVVSLEVLKHFIDSKSKVFSKKAKTRTGFTKPQSFYISPTEETYNKPVFFLTSHQTSSAPESLTMASMPFENITIIGSRTMGITSDVLEKKLPNGWDLYLSNEIQVNYKGNCYEGVGVPPDIEINYPVDENLFIEDLALKLKNGDEAIEKVFHLMRTE